MVAFADMEQPSALFRLNRYEHEGQQHWSASFTCPGCGESHGITDKWQFNGDWEKPTFSPSYLTWHDPDPRARPGKFRDGFRCHSFIRDGRIEFLSDCTHHLAGQTVDMIPFDMERT